MKLSPLTVLSDVEIQAIDAVRGPFASWRAAGGRDTAALARLRAGELAPEITVALDSRRAERLRECLAAAGASLAGP